MNVVRARVSESGRLSLPAEFRKAVGLERGGDVVVELAGHEMRIRTIDEVVDRAQELSRRMLSNKPDITVDDFLAERRREAAKGVTSAVLDASALLALLRGEPGGQIVRPFLADAAMSTLNWAEVVGYYSRSGSSEHDIRAMLDPLPVDRIPFDETVAYIAGMMLPITRTAGLSIGDRACLALAKHLNVKVLTADRAWKTLGSAIGIDVELIR